MEQEAREDVLWDVIEECFDEAAFMLTILNRACDSATLTLADVERGLEPRLRAYVDAVADSAPEVEARLLVPAFADAESDPSRATAAALVALSMNRVELVEQELFTGNRAVERALVLAASNDWVANACARLERETVSLRRTALLRVIGARGVRVNNLLASLQSDQQDEVIAALQAVAACDAKLHLPVTQSLLDYPWLVEATVVPALTLGSRFALESSRTLAVDPARAHALPFLLLALFGGIDHHKVLLDALDQPARAEDALFALGFTGRADLTPLILAHLTRDQPRLKKLAAEAFGMITGADVRGDDFVSLEAPDEEVPPLDEDLARDLTPNDADSLPMPNGDALRKWWNENGSRFNIKERWLLGQPWTLAQCIAALERTTMRCRHPLALWLKVCTGGRAIVDTRAFGSTQRSALAMAMALSERDLTRRYERW